MVVVVAFDSFHASFFSLTQLLCSERYILVLEVKAIKITFAILFDGRIRTMGQPMFTQPMTLNAVCLPFQKLIFLSRYHIDVFTCIICMIPKFKLLHTRMRRLLIVFFVLTTITKLDYIIRQFMTKQLISCCVIENAISCISFPLLRLFSFPMILLCLFQIQCYFFQSNLNIFFLKLTFYFVFFLHFRYH